MPAPRLCEPSIQFQIASSRLCESLPVLDEEERTALLRTAKDVVTKLEKPEEVIMHYAFEVGKVDQ